MLPGNIEVRYELSGGKGERKVYFDSLKSLCDFYIMEMLTSQTPKLHLCKRCGKPIQDTWAADGVLLRLLPERHERAK